MQKLKIPPYSFRITEKNGKQYVFDESRTKWVALTPEEWVRQHFFRYLTLEKGFPKSLIALERKVNINGLSQRFDMLVFDRKGKPLMLAEFKAPGIAISQHVFRQLSRYNEMLSAPYCLVSNGLEIFLHKLDFENKRVEILEEIPGFQTMAGNV
jgi:hypothetical protein